MHVDRCCTYQTSFLLAVKSARTQQICSVLPKLRSRACSQPTFWTCDCKSFWAHSVHWSRGMWVYLGTVLYLTNLRSPAPTLSARKGCSHCQSLCTLDCEHWRTPVHLLWGNSCLWNVSPSTDASNLHVFLETLQHIRRTNMTLQQYNLV